MKTLKIILYFIFLASFIMGCSDSEKKQPVKKEVQKPHKIHSFKTVVPHKIFIEDNIDSVNYNMPVKIYRNRRGFKYVFTDKDTLNTFSMPVTKFSSGGRKAFVYHVEYKPDTLEMYHDTIVFNNIKLDIKATKKVYLNGKYIDVLRCDYSGAFGGFYFLFINKSLGLICKRGINFNVNVFFRYDSRLSKLQDVIVGDSIFSGKIY